MDKKNILITGGAGFIGSNLSLRIQKVFPNSNIVVFDCFRNENKFSNGNLMSFGHYDNLIDFNGEIICGNLNNIDDLNVLKKYNFDYIFHQAAISDTRVDNQEAIIKTNLNSFYFILDLAKKNNAKLIYASSAATYGNNKSPQRVGFENPNNAYAFSKFSMDKLALNFLEKNSKVDIIGLRYFNVYGKREFYKNSTASTILQFALQVLKGNPPRLFEKSNKIFRDFIYIEDVIDANILASSSSFSGIFNIGTGVPRSFQDVADIILKNLKSDFVCEYIKNPYSSNYQFHTEADISETKNKLGFNPKWTLENGIIDYLPEIRNIHKKHF